MNRFELRRVISNSINENTIKPPELSAFNTVHEAWVDSEYILSQDTVTLHGVTHTKAWFCVSSQPVYSLLPQPFVFLNQNSLASHLVVMDHDAFHSLADSVGDPSIPVTIVNHIGRCGSTMVMQILDEVPGLRVISEPYALLNTLALYNKGSISQAKHDSLVASCLKLQCKLENTSVKQIVIKLAFPNMAQLPLIRTLMPSLRHILLFRDIQASTLSLWKVNQILVSGCSDQENREVWVPMLGFPPSVSPGNYPSLILSGSLSLGVMVSLLIQLTVRAARETVETHGHFLEMFSYEQLLEDGASVERLLRLFVLEDGGKVEVTGKWRKVDSQGTSLISRDNTAQQKTAGFPSLEEQEEIAAFLGIPSPAAGVEAVRRYILTGHV